MQLQAAQQQHNQPLIAALTAALYAEQAVLNNLVAQLQSCIIQLQAAGNALSVAIAILDDALQH